MGKIEYPNGDVYEGELQNDLPRGKGKQIYSVPKFKRKSEYTGDFNNGVMEGYGKSIIITGPSKGSFYEGEWKNYISTEGFGDSRKDGYGIEYEKYEDEKTYEGYFKKDLRHGKGTITFNDGTKKDCEYKEGKEI